MSTRSLQVMRMDGPVPDRVRRRVLGGAPGLGCIPTPEVSLLCAQAALWEAHGYPEGLLLQGEALAAAEAWAAGQTGELGEAESDLLSASRAERMRVVRESHLGELLRGILVASVIVTLVLASLLFAARGAGEAIAADLGVERQRVSQIEVTLAEAEARAELEASRRAEAERRVTAMDSALLAASSRALAAQSLAMVERDRELALLLAIEALRRGPADAWDVHSGAGSAILRALGHRGWRSLAALSGSEMDAGYAWRSPDGLLLTHADSDDPSIWDAATGERLGTLHGCGPVRGVAWNPAGRTLVTQGLGGPTTIWAIDGTPQATLAPDAEVAHMAWYAGGQFLATLDYGGCPALWDVRTGQRLEIGSAEGVLDSLLGSPSGPSPDQIARPSSEPAARLHADASDGFGASGMSRVLWRDVDQGQAIYLASPGALAAVACSRVDRNLTRAEWATYVGSETSYRETCQRAW